MKICVMSFSGNVGKTTVAGNLLVPRLGAKLFSIESVNQDASIDNVSSRRLRPRQFDELQEQLLSNDNVVVDVGASNAEQFLEAMEQFDQSHTDYDAYVIPAVAERKQIIDTITTIDALVATGVELERIKPLFNKVPPKDDVRSAFLPLFGHAHNIGLELDPAAVLHTNQVFELIKDYDMSLAEVIADETDHRELLRDETTEAGKARRVRRLAIKRLATTCDRDMDSAFAALFPNA